LERFEGGAGAVDHRDADMFFPVELEVEDAEAVHQVWRVNTKFEGAGGVHQQDAARALEVSVGVLEGLTSVLSGSVERSVRWSQSQQFKWACAGER